MALLLLVYALCLCCRLLGAQVGAPQDVRALTLSPTEILATWTSVPDSGGVAVEFYVLEISQSAFPDTQLLATFQEQTSDGLETQWTLEPLEEYVPYLVRVRAETNAGPGPFSATAVNTTYQAAPSAPPRNLTVSNRSSTELLVEWQRPNELDVNGLLNNFIIRYQKIGEQQNAVISVVGGSFLDTLIAGLEDYTSYTVQVEAFTIAGGPMATAVGTTSENVPGEPPQSVQAQSTQPSSINVQWTTPPGNTIHGILRGYIIQYAKAESVMSSLMFIQLSPSVTSHTLDGLEPATVYRVQVAAVTVGEGPYSSPLFVTTMTVPISDCLIVSDLTIASHRSTTEPTTDTVTVEINWAGPSDPACSHLTNLTVMATQSPPYPEERRRPSVFVCATLPGNETQFVIEQGLPYAEYTAILFAFNASSGESGAVMTETHRSLATEPGAVTELSAVSTSLHSINVTWELPWQPNGPILYYTLFYRPMTTLQTPPIASNGYITQQTETTHWAVIDLEAHTSYAIHVQAIGGDNMAAILPGVIAEEIIVLTAGANSTVAPPTINIPGPGATVSVVIGVTAAIVCVSLIVAASVVVITCVVVRHRRALYKMRYLATRGDPNSATLSSVITNEQAFSMTDCEAYEPSSPDPDRVHQTSQVRLLAPQSAEVDADDDPGYENAHRLQSRITGRITSRANRSRSPDEHSGYENLRQANSSHATSGRRPGYENLRLSPAGHGTSAGGHGYDVPRPQVRRSTSGEGHYETIPL